MPGGWAYAVVRDDVLTAMHSGGAKATTNNRMELKAALNGLRAVMELNAGEPIELVSDSRFTLDIANGSYLPKKHLEEALTLREAAVAAAATTRWVRGHNGDKWNEAVDALAHHAKQAFIRSRARRET